MTESAPVDQFKVEAGGGTQLNNGWHVERENHGVFDLAKGYGGPLDDGLHAVFIAAALFPASG